MFERFASQTRQAVACALEEARDSGTATIGCEHLLIAIARPESGPAAEALAAEGLSADRLRALAIQTGAQRLDAGALAVIGIDLDAVRRAAEAAFGPGALDRPMRSRVSTAGRPKMTPDAKTCLCLAVEAAQHGKHRWITPDHLLVGLLDQGNNAAVRLLGRAEVGTAALRADAIRRMNAA